MPHQEIRSNMRIFAKILSHKWQQWLEEHDKVDELVAGLSKVRLKIVAIDLATFIGESVSVYVQILNLRVILKLWHFPLTLFTKLTTTKYNIVS